MTDEGIYAACILDIGCQTGTVDRLVNHSIVVKANVIGEASG